MINSNKVILPELVGASFENKQVLGMSDDDYHSDWSSVSSSALRSVYQSPQHYLAYLYEAQNKKEKKENEALRFGKAAHCALLEPDRFAKNYIVVPDFGDQRKSENKLFKMNWYAEFDRPGLIKVTQEEYDDLRFGIDGILDHLVARDILKVSDGIFESSGFVRHESGLKSRFRPDFYCTKTGTNILVDFKTAKDNSYRGFQKAIGERLYNIQMAKYAHEFELLFGKKVDIILFIVVENKRPRTCAVYEFEATSRMHAKDLYHFGMNKIKKCITDNEWPSRQKTVESITSPDWLLAKTAEGL